MQTAQGASGRGFGPARLPAAGGWVSSTCCPRLPEFLTQRASFVPAGRSQELLQEFSWTQAAVPADLERRTQRLLASEAAPEGGKPAQEARRRRLGSIPC